eukprot:CAMPEP_0113522556 /NCGR_PEP_ID=MMETSP0014_2-20120614/45252_1 /TAXON_ID=2857 /ORGANISM="Nitzschia sp." /LENGTH=376 /DNA_ID=CAMNT_0000420621 /DNA_START=314 /DNA_END=1441 /DNA_ORIENTATION=- /assembly_acc=CAM_ASM_000159
MTDLSVSGSNADNVVVTDHDVLCGRGVSIAKHPGNQRLRALARSRFDASYCTEFSSNEKKALAEEIISHIKNLNPPGRFLRRPGRSNGDRGLDGPWEELSHKEAVKKACQSLRDCNRPDREGYATKVQAPKDVVLSAEDRARTGLSLKERAAIAAMEKDKLERESSNGKSYEDDDVTPSACRRLGSDLRFASATHELCCPFVAVFRPTAIRLPHCTTGYDQPEHREHCYEWATQLIGCGGEPQVRPESSAAEGVTSSSSSTLHGPTGVLPRTGETMTTSPALTSTNVATMPGTVNASAMDPLEPIRIDHHTPHDAFRHAAHLEGTSATMAVPVSASHHSGSPVRGHNIFFEDDCPSSPAGIGGPGDDGLPTASRFV